MILLNLLMKTFNLLFLLVTVFVSNGLLAQAGFFEPAEIVIDGNQEKVMILQDHELELGRRVVIRRGESRVNDTIAITRIRSLSLPQKNLYYRMFRITIRKQGSNVLTNRLGLRVYDGTTALYECSLSSLERDNFYDREKNVSYVIIHRGEPYELRKLYRRTETGQVTAKNLYSGTLNLLLRDCEYLKPQLKNVKFTEESIGRLLQEYDRCQGNQRGVISSSGQGKAEYAKLKARKFGLVAGTYSPVSTMIDNRFSITLGGYYQSNLMRSNSRAFFRLEGSFAVVSYNIVPLPPPGITNPIEFNGVIIPVVIGWRLANERARLVPYVELGGHIRAASIEFSNLEAIPQFGAGVTWGRFGFSLIYATLTSSLPKVYSAKAYWNFN